MQPKKQTRERLRDANKHDFLREYVADFAKKVTGFFPWILMIKAADSSSIYAVNRLLIQKLCNKKCSNKQPRNYTNQPDTARQTVISTIMCAIPPYSRARTINGWEHAVQQIVVQSRISRHCHNFLPLRRSHILLHAFDAGVIVIALESWAIQTQPRRLNMTGQESHSVRQVTNSESFQPANPFHVGRFTLLVSWRRLRPRTYGKIMKNRRRKLKQKPVPGTASWPISGTTIGDPVMWTRSPGCTMSTDSARRITSKLKGWITVETTMQLQNWW